MPAVNTSHCSNPHRVKRKRWQYQRLSDLSRVPTVRLEPLRKTSYSSNFGSATVLTLCPRSTRPSFVVVITVKLVLLLEWTQLGNAILRKREIWILQTTRDESFTYFIRQWHLAKQASTIIYRVGCRLTNRPVIQWYMTNICNRYSLSRWLNQNKVERDILIQWRMHTHTRAMWMTGSRVLFHCIDLLLFEWFHSCRIFIERANHTSVWSSKWAIYI